MKKTVKSFLLVIFLGVSQMAFAQCPCYDTFNAGWQAANSSYATCATNAGFSSLGSYISRNIAPTLGAIAAFRRCENTFYGQWDLLGAQWSYCVATNCRIE